MSPQAFLDRTWVSVDLVVQILAMDMETQRGTELARDTHCFGGGEVTPRAGLIL